MEKCVEMFNFVSFVNSPCLFTDLGSTGGQGRAGARRENSSMSDVDF